MTKSGETFQNRKRIVIVACLILIGIVGALFLMGKPAEKKLTQEQINEVNSHFEQLIPMPESSESDFMINPICHFFSSYYDDVSEMDMGEFVYYIKRETYLTEKDTAEYEKLKDAGFWLPTEKIEDCPVPFGRVPYETVESYLRTYANVGLSDMKNMGDAIYSDEYKCFYTYTSDFGLGHFQCIGGSIEGNRVILESEDAVLQLKRNQDHYDILSHTKK